MRHRTFAVLDVALIGAVALTGCTPAPAPAPTVTTTVTATVTATPAPAQPTAADAMTPLAAYSICFGIAMSTGSFTETDYTFPTYQADDVTAAPTAGAYEVLLGFGPKAGGYGVGYSCTIGGTLGAPVVTEARGPYDFG